MEITCSICLCSFLPIIYCYLMVISYPSPFPKKKKKSLQIIEACLVSLITSFISFGLPLLRKCSPCPDSDPDSGIECPRPPGMYGNYVNVSSDTGFCSFWITFKVLFTVDFLSDM